MVIGTGRHLRLARWALVGWVCTTGCGDDVVAITEGASSTGTGSGTGKTGSGAGSGTTGGGTRTGTGTGTGSR